jgi:hypothetical protein
VRVILFRVLGAAAAGAAAKAGEIFHFDPAVIISAALAIYGVVHKGAAKKAGA